MSSSSSSSSSMQLDIVSKKLYGREEELRILRDAVVGGTSTSGVNDNDKNSSTSSTCNDKEKIINKKLKEKKICFVHGKSGTGKTCLMNEFATSLGDDVYFLQGKYDQLYAVGGGGGGTSSDSDDVSTTTSSSTTPFAAIIAAFNQLPSQLKRQHEDSMRDQCLRYEASILTKIIPSFARYNKEQRGSKEVEGSETIPTAAVVAADSVINDSNDHELIMASERLAVAFISFLKIFCMKCHPIVLFMDDLQWMDQHSYRLLQAILNDNDVKQFIFLGGFRIEEEDDDSSSTTRSCIGSFLYGIPTPDINLKLGNLSCEAVNELLHGLKIFRSSNDNNNITPPSEQEATEEKEKMQQSLLTNVIYRKTSGNPYFIIQQLQTWQSLNLLEYNFVTNQWTWDIDAIEKSAETDLVTNHINVIDVVSSRIRALPENVLHLLKLAACLGYTVDINVLKEVLSTSSTTTSSSPYHTNINANAEGEEKVNDEFDITDNITSDKLFDDILSKAVTENLLEQNGSNLKFSHDRIQQCVYELIEQGAPRTRLHYQIGKHLKTLYKETEAETDHFLLLAVDQLNRASSLIKTGEERISLIKLNAKAALVAKKSAGIENVAAFLRRATSLVEPSFWRFYYDLILDVYTSSAEVESSLGHHEVSDKIIEVILENAATERDTVRALVVKFQTLGQQRQFGKAISEGCRILKMIGEPLPAIILPNVIIEFIKAQRDTKNKPQEFFTDLPPAKSEDAKIALKILRMGAVYGWNSGDSTFAGLAFLRSMRVTVREGSCEETPWIYSGFAFMLGELGKGKEAARFAELALSRGSLKKEGFPGSVILTYCNVIHWKRPISVALEPLLSAYRVGLETGDLFFGTICISCYALMYFSCGLPLGPFAVDLSCFGGQLTICRQEIPLNFIAPCHQLALNLLGKSDHPVELSRESIKRNQPELFTEHMLDDETDAAFLFTLYLQVFNAYILEDTSLVEKSLRRISKLKERRVGGTHIMNYFFALMDGLSGLLLVKESKSSSFFGKRLSNKAISELKRMTKDRPVNSITLLKFLQAEKAATISSSTRSSIKPQQVKKVQSMFNEVIKHFSRSGHVHYNAIANELAGKFMLKYDNEKDWARQYFERA